MIKAIRMPDLQLFMPGFLNICKCGGRQKFEHCVVVGCPFVPHRFLLFERDEVYRSRRGRSRLNCLFTASKSARALTARSVWSIWLIWFVLFIWLIWFIWLISFNQQTKQRSATCAGRLFQHIARADRCRM